MTPIQILTQLAIKQNQAKFPNSWQGDRSLTYFNPKYSDKTEKGLKKMISDFCAFTGNFAEPINNRGFRIDERQVVENCIGQMKTIGRVRWAKSSQEKGTSDMQARINAPCSPFPIPVAIEIKLPGDRQSKDQKAYQSKIETSGGLYWIVTCFDDFYQKFSDLMQMQIK